MKQIFLLILSFILVSSCTNDKTDNIVNEIDLSKAIETGLVNSRGEVLFLDGSRNQITGKYDSIKVFSIHGSDLIIYLNLNRTVATDKDGSVIFDVSKAPGKYWGWDVGVVKEKERNISLGIYFQWWANLGTSTTDQLTVIWNAQKDMFILQSFNATDL